jgi:hypothetical protein
VQDEAARAYWTEVKRAISASNPDVEHLALASQAPLASGTATSKYNDAPGLVVTSWTVEPSFFPLLRIPLLAGRNFEAHDRSELSLIVSRRLALEMYGTLDVVGTGFPRSTPTRTIVGVVGDAPLIDVSAAHVAELYSPVDARSYGTVLLLARTTGSPERLLGPMRAAARAADGRVLPKTWLPSTLFEQNVRARRIASTIASVVGMLALSLACVGILGLVGCSVAVRTKEIGIRRALGAERGAITRLLLGQLFLPVTLGLLVGAIGAASVATVLEGDPFYLPTMGLAIPAGALALIVSTAAVAVSAPVSRALGANPLQALKHE